MNDLVCSLMGRLLSPQLWVVRITTQELDSQQMELQLLRSLGFSRNASRRTVSKGNVWMTNCYCCSL